MELIRATLSICPLFWSYSFLLGKRPDLDQNKIIYLFIPETTSTKGTQKEDRYSCRLYSGLYFFVVIRRRSYTGTRVTTYPGPLHLQNTRALSS